MSPAQKFQEYIADHPQESLKSALEMSHAIQHSPLCYTPLSFADGEKLWTWTLQIPKFFTETDRRRFIAICDQIYTIFEKVIRAYKKDPKIRRLFHFSPALVHMIRHDPGYETLIPMLRVDIFYNEETGDFQFCEFNTDGTSAMFENDTMYELLKYNNAWMHFQIEHEYMPLVDSWIDAFLEDFRQARGDETPSVVITDFLENAYLPELYAFEQAFQKRGISCHVVDIREFVYEDGCLKDSQGRVYNAVYRRAVTRDVMHHIHDVQAFINAYMENAVTVIGAMQTQIPHCKVISEALMEPAVQELLTEEERAFLQAHLPKTMDLTSKTAPMVGKEKDSWILKPQDGYAAKGVWAGVDVSDRLWKKLVHDCTNMGYVAQKYIPHYHTPNMDPLHDEGFKDYANLTGLYVYNGKFAGVYSRLSDAGIVSTQYNERMVPTIFVPDDQSEEKKNQ